MMPVEPPRPPPSFGAMMIKALFIAFLIGTAVFIVLVATIQAIPVAGDSY